MSKSIIIVGPAYPLRGGLATYNQLLATKLQEQGHSVRIVTFSLQYPNILFPGKTQYSTDIKPENIEIEVSLNSVNPLNWLSLGNTLRKEKPDLVIFRYWMPFMGPSLGTLGRIIRKNKHTKVVTIADNIIPHEKRFFDTPFTKYFVNSCDGFVTMSESVLEDLKQFDSTKPVAYNPHPMYESFGPQLDKADARKKLGLAENGKYLLFFGFIRKYKGLDILLRAFADKRIQEAGIKLIIAGEYYDKPDEYQAIIEAHGLEKALVQANDFIPDSEVSTYFSAADMVVQTYKTATQSGVTQIAYYYHNPMLVTDVGGLAELVPHNKVGYVTSTDIDEIADAILDFYENKREAEFVENIKTERLRFTWESMIAKLFEVGGL
ncbi:MAG TPA: glycosyl transferase family 1 [Bacteroidetes bacterium]|nr:glycosyl transferase family 1 [Bacteroidota bacterium]